MVTHMAEIIIIYQLINGKGHIIEYNRYTNDIIFEREYLNGEKNGKGDEYDDYGNLSFEGEYLNGHRIGKGKEYGYESRLKFEGEFFNGYRLNGKAYIKGRLEF